MTNNKTTKQPKHFCDFVYKIFKPPLQRRRSLRKIQLWYFDSGSCLLFYHYTKDSFFFIII